MSENRKKIATDADLSICSLQGAIHEIGQLTGFEICEFYNVIVSDSQLFGAIVIRDSKCYDKEKSEFCYKKVFFDYNKEFKKEYWEVEGFLKGKFYMVYSNGA